MRLMRSHNLAYFRWFLEHKKSRLHIAVQTGFNAYSGNIKCVLCDRMKWYQNTFVLSITIKLFCFINGILELRNVAVLVKNKVVVAFVDFITEVVAATFIAVVACANLVAALCVLCAIGFSFVQCEELRNLVALDVVVPIYAVFLHNIDLTVMSRA